MNLSDIPGLNLLPPKWQPWAVAIFAASPYVTRAVYSLMHNGGIKGVLSSIWLGTNAPKTTPTPTNETKGTN